MEASTEAEAIAAALDEIEAALAAVEAAVSESPRSSWSSLNFVGRGTAIHPVSENLYTRPEWTKYRTSPTVDRDGRGSVLTVNKLVFASRAPWSVRGVYVMDRSPFI
jgi:hypothetical protein